MNDLNETEARWQTWVEQTAALLNVDAGLVDIHAIHDLTKTIAHDLERPMAPVGSFMLGLAMGVHGDSSDPATLKALIESTTRCDAVDQVKA
ncbi:DUF6457 domain-containing protein [Austwickia chelonae]|uniref:DUF6457 domain-containing protein n=1 Tax=Austwickia chelonae TaxID=100225 RepID=UPI000E258AA3|nr:DUF6457 domain-containing protein [Austwickia chelonae]